jgi:hypothetical protein
LWQLLLLCGDERSAGGAIADGDVARFSHHLCGDLEGFAFFTEAIFLGIYLYGWTRVASAAAPYATLQLLLAALIAGVILLFPSYYYLFRIFKSRANRGNV